jgi:glycosyltransferase involved in cell wall biosynthesis
MLTQIQKPFVTISIPTYNGATYLEECLNSVLAQTFTDFEILIVDDQSSDATFNIAQEYAAKDARICVLRNEKNLGLVGNWNRCFELAQGEWIKFVFQDDLIAPTCLEKMLAASKPDSSIICCRRNFIFGSDTPDHIQQFFKEIKTLENLLPDSTEISATYFCKAVLNDIGYNYVGEPTAVMLRRNVFHRFGSFHPNLIQICDLEFWTRIAVHTGIVYIPETLATFRLHDKATSSKNHTSRQYRKDILDPLILLHDFALHPTYEPLRIVAKSSSLPIDLIALLSQRSYQAWKNALRDPDYLVEWKNVTTLYPAISKFAKRSLMKHSASYLIQKFRYLYKKINNLVQNSNLI